MMWLRVFAPDVVEVPPALLAERLHAAGSAVVPHFKGDDLGWTTGELHLPKGGTPILLARYLTKHDDLRDDLNSHAAELETMTHDPARDEVDGVRDPDAATHHHPQAGRSAR